MKLPKPEPGLVFRYDYLWHSQRPARAVSGKDRPACLMATLDDETDPRIVLILPITHSPPVGETVAVEIPQLVGKKLGLDDARSWIVISEANVDFWPNPGLTPVPGRRGGYSYGFLPPALFERVREQFLVLLAERRARLVHRSGS